jgi:hypothetical protein
MNSNDRLAPVKIDYKDDDGYESYDVVMLDEKYDNNVKELFDCYTTFLVTRKYSHEKIKELRMDSIIENYIHLYDIEGNLEREMLRKAYKENVSDSFDKKLNPPKCFFAEARRERIAEEIAEKKERDTDDIGHHYKSINDKYKYIYEVFAVSPHSANNPHTQQSNGKNEDDSEILSEYNYYEREEDYSHSSYNSDYYYDDYFSDTDSDYTSD